MKPTQFPEANVIFSKDQPEYSPLPAHKVGDEKGRVITCWELSDEEIAEVIKTRKVYLELLTFNRSLTPVYLTALRSDIYLDQPAETLSESPAEDQNKEV
jgi:hypothetical protein